jgi:hypothetical protein
VVGPPNHHPSSCIVHRASFILLRDSIRHLSAPCTLHVERGVAEERPSRAYSKTTNPTTPHGRRPATATPRLRYREGGDRDNEGTETAVLGLLLPRERTHSVRQIRSCATSCGGVNPGVTAGGAAPLAHPQLRLICHKPGLDQRIPGLGQHIPGQGQRKPGLVHSIRDLGQHFPASDPRPEASLETNQAWIVAEEPFQHRPQSRFVLPQASNVLPQASNALPLVSNALTQASCVLPQASRVSVQASRILPQASRVLPQASRVSPQVSSALNVASSVQIFV